MNILSKPNITHGAIILFIGILLFSNGFGIDMQSHLVLGLLTLIPAGLIIFGAKNKAFKFAKEEMALMVFLFFSG
jgi:hypothetical protein